MASSPPIPPSPFESNEWMNKRGPRFKQTKCDGRYHHTVRRPLGHRRTFQNENISLNERIWRNGLQIYEEQISGFVTNMTELLELDPPEVEEAASVCEMGFAFRQRAVRAHRILRANNMDRIRRATEGALNEETARKRALEDWSRRQSRNERSPSMESTSEPFGLSRTTTAV